MIGGLLMFFNRNKILAMEERTKAEARLISAAAFVEGGVQPFRMHAMMLAVYALKHFLKVILLRYNCIENEILLPLRTPINIAPYRSKGADKAVEIDQ